MPRAAAAAAPYSPRSLNRVLGILAAIARSGGGLSLAELATHLDAPKSSLLLLLRPLVAMDYLAHAAARYTLGAAAFRLAADVMAVHSFPALIRPFLEELAARTRETVFLAAIDREARVVTYVERIESPQAVRYSVPTGTTRALYPAAAGRVLLAFQDDAWRSRYVRTVRLSSLGARRTVDRAGLRRELDAIRARGIAISEGEAIEGAAGIAAPVLGADGHATHALLIGAPTTRFRSELPALRAVLTDVATRASLVLRGDPQPAPDAPTRTSGP